MGLKKLPEPFQGSLPDGYTLAAGHLPGHAHGRDFFFPFTFCHVQRTSKSCQVAASSQGSPAKPCKHRYAPTFQFLRKVTRDGPYWTCRSDGPTTYDLQI
jgi:hypothetical protein